MSDRTPLIQLAGLVEKFSLPVPVVPHAYSQRYCRACGCVIGPGRTGRACKDCLAVEQGLAKEKPVATGFGRKVSTLANRPPTE